MFNLVIASVTALFIFFLFYRRFFIGWPHGSIRCPMPTNPPSSTMHCHHHSCPAQIRRIPAERKGGSGLRVYFAMVSSQSPIRCYDTRPLSVTSASHLAIASVWSRERRTMPRTMLREKATWQWTNTPSSLIRNYNDRRVGKPSEWMRKWFI